MMTSKSWLFVSDDVKAADRLCKLGFSIFILEKAFLIAKFKSAGVSFRIFDNATRKEIHFVFFDATGFSYKDNDTLNLLRFT